MESVAGRGACLETSEHEVLQRDGVSGSWQVGKPGLEGRHGHPGRGDRIESGHECGTEPPRMQPPLSEIGQCERAPCAGIRE